MFIIQDKEATNHSLKQLHPDTTKLRKMVKIVCISKFRVYLKMRLTIIWSITCLYLCFENMTGSWLKYCNFDHTFLENFPLGTMDTINTTMLGSKETFSYLLFTFQLSDSPLRTQTLFQICFKIQK